MNDALSDKVLISDPMAALPIGMCATLACLWEVTAPKPGNVHPAADFDDASFADFITSAAVVGPTIDRAEDVGVGATVLSAVRATRTAVGTNTNLGTVLLLAPLAAVPRGQPLQDGIVAVLDGLSASDADLVYEAIRFAQPGGLGRVDEADLTRGGTAPGGSLTAAMSLVADWDLVARQYMNGFREVLQCAAPWIEHPLLDGYRLSDAVENCFLRLMAEYPDGMIARKCGRQIALQAASRAAEIVARGPIGCSGYVQGISDLDGWLRGDGHRRNPGTTADLIAAGLFVLLREGRLTWPLAY